MALEMTVQAKLETGLSFDIETGSGFHIMLDAPISSEEQARGPSPMEMLQRDAEQDRENAYDLPHC